MQLAEYKEKAILTIKYRGMKTADLEHMIIGVFSEFNELFDALDKDDDVNILEELGDLSWYLVNYATLQKFELVHNKTGVIYDAQDLIHLTSQLANLVKREAIYNKEIDKELEVKILQEAFDTVCRFSRDAVGLDSNSIFDIERAWDMNIEKLHKVRYKNAAYSDEAAQNRDEGAERKALEGNSASNT
jgi:NTP pyrophosphatase (non-canonical NTP hydrolase)